MDFKFFTNGMTFNLKLNLSEKYFDTYLYKNINCKKPAKETP